MAPLAGSGTSGMWPVVTRTRTASGINIQTSASLQTPLYFISREIFSILFFKRERKLNRKAGLLLRPATTLLLVLAGFSNTNVGATNFKAVYSFGPKYAYDSAEIGVSNQSPQ